LYFSNKIKLKKPFLYKYFDKKRVRKERLFNRTNSYELVGKCAVFDSDEKYTFASYLIKVRTLNMTIAKFIKSYINSSLCRITQIEPQVIQQNGQANFNGTKLANIIIPLPSLSEQARIVGKLDALMALCDSMEASIRESQTVGEALLQQVLREALQA
jgi:type I restriction enzyme S subunit